MMMWLHVWMSKQRRRGRCYAVVSPWPGLCIRRDHHRISPSLCACSKALRGAIKKKNKPKEEPAAAPATWRERMEKKRVDVSNAQAFPVLSREALAGVPVHARVEPKPDFIKSMASKTAWDALALEEEEEEEEETGKAYATPADPYAFTELQLAVEGVASSASTEEEVADITQRILAVRALHCWHSLMTTRAFYIDHLPTFPW